MYLYVSGLPGQIHHHLFLHSDVYVQLCNLFCICSCTRLTLREMISEEQKPNSVFSLVFFGDPFDLLSDCLQTSHPSLSGMNFFFCVCVSGSAHRVLVFTACVTPLGFLCRSDGSFGDADLGGRDIKAGGVRTESPGGSRATSRDSLF